MSNEETKPKKGFITHLGEIFSEILEGAFIEFDNTTLIVSSVLLYVIGIAGTLIIGGIIGDLGFLLYESVIQQMATIAAEFLVPLSITMAMMLIGLFFIGIMKDIANWVHDIGIMLDKSRAEEKKNADN